MTQGEVINKLTSELVAWTGDIVHEPLFRQYITMALDIGVNHFTKDMEEVAMLTKGGLLVKRFRSVSEAVKNTGIRQGDISSVLTGAQHSAKGYLFRKTSPLETLSYCEISKS